MKEEILPTDFGQHIELREIILKSLHMWWPLQLVTDFWAWNCKVNRLWKERITMRWDSWCISSYQDWKWGITIPSYFLGCYKPSDFKREQINCDSIDGRREISKSNFYDILHLNRDLGRAEKDARGDTVFWFQFFNALETALFILVVKLNMSFLFFF